MYTFSHQPHQNLTIPCYIKTSLFCRQSGMGYNSFMARLGVSVAPLILLLDDVWKELPQVVLCSLALLGGLVARTLSETRNKCLPETIEDIEHTSH